MACIAQSVFPGDMKQYYGSQKQTIIPSTWMLFAFLKNIQVKNIFKGPKAGQYSCNPLGKNPGDLWIIPNVKHNHPEKTKHPCQFPIELIERLILSLTNEGDLVIDPYMGVGTTAGAAVLRGRRAAGAEIVEEYNIIAKERILSAFTGQIKRRPMDRPIYEPNPSLSVARPPDDSNDSSLS